MEKREDTRISTGLVVIGAGPAGMMAAIAATENSAANHGTAGVVIVEQLSRPGAKLLATGGGRCNLTCELEAEGFVRRFGRCGPFVRRAIAELDSWALREFFSDLGVETVCEEGGAVYPATHSAGSVQKAMLDRCGELGVRIILGAAAKELVVREGAVRGLVVGTGPGVRCGDSPAEAAAGPAGTSGDFIIDAPRVVVACGGRSYPESGGTGGGYALAARAGHKIVAPSPALVDLRTKETWPGSCAGISVKGARISIETNRKEMKGSAKRQAISAVTGDMLFTHEGISGPAVLDLSGDVGELLRNAPEVPIRLQLWPGMNSRDWRGRLEWWRQSSGRRAIAGLLAELMPARLAGAICDLAGVGPDTKAAHLDSCGRVALSEALACMRLKVIGTGSFERAMVTRGGVAMDEVEARTMASRIVRGLFFAGEVLDVDGPCGGFNLQWAFSSGRLAGICASR